MITYRRQGVDNTIKFIDPGGSFFLAKKSEMDSLAKERLKICRKMLRTASIVLLCFSVDNPQSLRNIKDLVRKTVFLLCYRVLD